MGGLSLLFSSCPANSCYSPFSGSGWMPRVLFSRLFQISIKNSPIKKRFCLNKEQDPGEDPEDKAHKLNLANKKINAMLFV